jgi:hypothetical protein
LAIILILISLTFVVQCSAHCGNGVKTRKVFCGKFDGETVKKVDDDKCDLRKKYEAESNCTGKEECKGQWYAGPWTAVSIFVILCLGNY